MCKGKSSLQRAAGYRKRNLPSRKSYGTASCAEAKPAFALKRFDAVRLTITVEQ
jgi:hypothetical protein